MLGACTPNAVTFYRPSVDGGEIIIGKCVPVERSIKFKINDLEISSNAFTTSRTNQLNIVLSLKPIAGQKIYFVSGRFIVRDLKKKAVVPLKNLFVSRIDRINSPSVPFPEKGFDLSPRGFNFTVYIAINDTDLELFELISPPININGIEYEFPVIRFEQKSWFGISPLNC